MNSSLGAIKRIFADEYRFGNFTLSYLISIELVNFGLILWLSSTSNDVLVPL